MNAEKRAIVEKKSRCPSCAKNGQDTTGDNLVSYSDGGQYCFACGYTNQQKGKGMNYVKGIHKPIQGRNLTEDACRFFDYTIAEMPFDYAKLKKGNGVQVATYKDTSGQIVAQKIRDRDKNMVFLKPKKTDAPLYGMWLWEPHEKIPVIVTEGEIDAVSIAQATDYKLPVVSVPNGAAGAEKSLKEHLDYLAGFKYVILAFDNDEAGREAVDKCLSLFDPYKVKVVTWRRKDANDLLVEDGPAAVRDNIYKASSPLNNDIANLDDIRDQLVEVKTADYHLQDWTILDNAMHGLRRGELTTIMAGAGLGKTEVVTEIVYQLVEGDQTNVGIMSFEQPPKKTYKRIIGKSLKKRLDVDVDEFTKKQLAKFVYPRDIFCYDKSGRVRWGDVRNKLHHFAKGLECGVVIIDNLSNIAATFDDDERRGIDKAMLELSSAAIDLNIHIFLICHVSRPARGSTPLDRGRELSLSDARGSEAIGQHSNYVFGLERNALADDEKIRTTSILRCLKDREFGTARGQKFFFRFDFDTGLLTQIEKPVVDLDIKSFFTRLSEMDGEELYVLELTHDKINIELNIRKPGGIPEVYLEVYTDSPVIRKSGSRDLIMRLFDCPMQICSHTTMQDRLLLEPNDIGEFICDIVDQCSDVTLRTKNGDHYVK